MRLDELELEGANGNGGGLSLAASLELHAGATERLVREMKARNGADRVMQPTFRHFPASLIAPASGLGIFWFAGPDAGHKWEVRSIFISGVTRETTIASQGADIYVTPTDLRNALGGVAPSLSAIGTGDQRDFVTGSPVTTNNPNLTAVGVPATVQVPAGQSWNLSAITFLFTASAAAATRTPRITIRDAGGRILYQWTSPTNVAATQVEQITLSPGSPTISNGSGTVANPFTVTGPLPALTLAAGSTITADAINEDVADTITVGTVIYTTTGLPISKQYSSLQLAIYAPDDLFVIVSGLATGVEVHCNVDIEDSQLGNIQVVEAI